MIHVAVNISGQLYVTENSTHAHRVRTRPFLLLSKGLGARLTLHQISLCSIDHRNHWIGQWTREVRFTTRGRGYKRGRGTSQICAALRAHCRTPLYKCHVIVYSVVLHLYIIYTYTYSINAYGNRAEKRIFTFAIKLRHFVRETISHV